MDNDHEFQFESTDQSEKYFHSTNTNYGRINIDKEAKCLLDEYIEDVLERVKCESVVLHEGLNGKIDVGTVNCAIMSYFGEYSLIPENTVFMGMSERDKRVFEVVDVNFGLFERYLFSNPFEWDCLGVMNDVKGYTFPDFPVSDYSCGKGEGYLDYSVSDVVDYILNPDHLGKWDYFSSGGDVLEILDQRTHLVHLRYKAQICALSQARDFLIVRHHVIKGDCHYIFACSVEDSKYPPLPQFMRAHILFGGFLVEPSNGQTKLTYISCVDVKKPNLPDFIMSKFFRRLAEKQPQNVYLVRKNLDMMEFMATEQ